VLQGEPFLHVPDSRIQPSLSSVLLYMRSFLCAFLFTNLLVSLGTKEGLRERSIYCRHRKVAIDDYVKSSSIISNELQQCAFFQVNMSKYITGTKLLLTINVIRGLGYLKISSPILMRLCIYFLMHWPGLFGMKVSVYEVSFHTAGW